MEIDRATAKNRCMDLSTAKPVYAHDDWVVSLGESWEAAFWMHELRCSADELRRAVSAVGPTVGAVRAYLALPQARFAAL